MEKHTNIQQKTPILFVLGKKGMEFKDRFAEWRKARGFTQETLADASGYSVPYISNIETGKTRPSEKACKRFAPFLGIPADKILFEAGWMPDVAKNIPEPIIEAIGKRGELSETSIRAIVATIKALREDDMKNKESEKDE